MTNHMLLQPQGFSEMAPFTRDRKEMSMVKLSSTSKNYAFIVLNEGHLVRSFDVEQNLTKDYYCVH